MLLTIFTPSYNRIKTLTRLYRSLQEQRCQNFEWLIVDDGSRDNTQELVQQWVKHAPFPIRYAYQENGGKHRATARGILMASGDLFFCVDSDDYLPPDATALIADAWAEESCPECAGIVGYKEDTSGRPLGAAFPDGVSQCSTYGLSALYKSCGERSLVYRTEVLKRFPAPDYVGENFLTECVVYDQIAAEYSMLLLPESLTICEYQDDGYTRNLFAIMLNNPCGYCHYYAQRIDMAQRWTERLGYMVRYLAFRHLSHHRGLRYQGRYGHLLPLLSPLGRLLVCYYKLKSQL